MIAGSPQQAPIGDVLVLGEPGNDWLAQEWVLAFQRETGNMGTFLATDAMVPPYKDAEWPGRYQSKVHLIHTELTLPECTGLVYVNGQVDGSWRQEDSPTNTQGFVGPVGHIAFGFALQTQKPAFVSHNLPRPVTAGFRRDERAALMLATGVYGLGVRALEGTYDLNRLMTQQGDAQ